MASCDRAIALGTARVPDLCLHYYSTFQYYLLSEELDTDGGRDASEDPLMVPAKLITVLLPLQYV